MKYFRRSIIIYGIKVYIKHQNSSSFYFKNRNISNITNKIFNNSLNINVSKTIT
jgi:hypothetical protein